MVSDSLCLVDFNFKNGALDMIENGASKCVLEKSDKT